LADPAEGGTATAAEPAPRPASRFAGRRVVVVEDDGMVARALMLSLQSLGMSVVIYGSAEEALADPDILGADAYICDYWLPGMSGSQFFETLQQRAVGRSGQ
jgi:FixJ family two-component response regulator